MIPKKIILIVTNLIILNAFAQQYTFDYVLEYGHTVSGKMISEYRFINSEDNKFMLTISEHNDKLAMLLTLENGKFFRDSIATTDFFVEAIALRCPTVGRKNYSEYENIDKFLYAKRYDTVFSGENCVHISLTSKIVENGHKTPVILHYLISNGNNFKLPLFDPIGMLYKAWKLGGDIPKGLVKKSYMEFDGQKVDILDLLQCVPIKKHIILDTRCK